MAEIKAREQIEVQTAVNDRGATVKIEKRFTEVAMAYYVTVDEMFIAILDDTVEPRLEENGSVFLYQGTHYIGLLSTRRMKKGWWR